MTTRIIFILLLVSTHTALADWVHINGLKREEQWNLPPQSAGKNKFLWQRYIVNESGEDIQITEIRKYDCYDLKYYLIQAQGKTETGKTISIPLPSTWYRITRNSEYHRQLVEHGVCPN